MRRYIFVLDEVLFFHLPLLSFSEPRHCFVSGCRQRPSRSTSTDCSSDLFPLVAQIWSQKFSLYLELEMCRV